MIDHAAFASCERSAYVYLWQGTCRKAYLILTSSIFSSAHKQQIINIGNDWRSVRNSLHNVRQFASSFVNDVSCCFESLPWHVRDEAISLFRGLPDWRLHLGIGESVTVPSIDSSVVKATESGVDGCLCERLGYRIMLLA